MVVVLEDLLLVRGVLGIGIVAFRIRGGFLVLGLLGCGKSRFGEYRYGGSEFGV